MVFLFCITGMPGSGKSVISETARSLGLKVIVMGDIIREEAEARGIKKTPGSLGELMLALRKEEGNDVVAKRCLSKVSDASVAVIEGIRSLDELNFFRRNAKVCLLAVHASPNTRFQRLLKRGRPDDPKDLETFNERDMRELQVGIGSVIALADKVFINEGTMEELINSVKEFFAREIHGGQSNSPG
ncbi:MAG: AAA family ATPase [Candidatus Methanomethylicaceae archaeon]|nr:AAA family ATPase [Candidatus Verstraetearchaeota archaeon]